ncbi:Hypothetical predicted protein [Mytilus galloprovincialis]|uniref:P-type domain-containing protein n=1 Tax=Mytilus galloprovincialis TaxID=29158 RepID=A0A8B6FNS5_MYTGA|nr:Hypothetical predicted protein [Mytilus galloprovincialis]
MIIYPMLLVSVVFGIVYAADVCHVAPIYRQECGWGGISPEKCESHGCCFDSSIKGVKWCFKKANRGLFETIRQLSVYVCLDFMEGRSVNVRYYQIFGLNADGLGFPEKHVRQEAVVSTQTHQEQNGVSKRETIDVSAAEQGNRT